MLRKTFYRALLLIAALTLSMSSIAGCTGAEETGGSDAMEMEHDDDLEHESSGEDVVRIPNDRAVIRIVSPENGAAFSAGEDIVIEVEIENFELNVDGSHWHVYVDGVSYGMVVGDTTRQVLRNLEPGEYMVTAHLANGDHEELEEPGMIMITITE